MVPIVPVMKAEQPMKEEEIEVGIAMMQVSTTS